MKRAVLGFIGGAIISVALVLTLQAQERTSTPPVAPGSEATTAAEEPAFTFTDEAQMQQFARLWQQRQATLARMSVLQAYWNQEQAELQQVNAQLLAQYNVDVNTAYTLDTDRMVLLERGIPTVPPPTHIDQSPASTPAPPADTSAD